MNHHCHQWIASVTKTHQWIAIVANDTCNGNIILILIQQNNLPKRIHNQENQPDDKSSAQSRAKYQPQVERASVRANEISTRYPKIDRQEGGKSWEHCFDYIVHRLLECW
jgi:hypothetical protein